MNDRPMTKKTQTHSPVAEAGVDDAMSPETWALLHRLAQSRFHPTQLTRASREASTLYALGLATNPEKGGWRATKAGVDAIARRAARP